MIADVFVNRVHITHFGYLHCIYASIDIDPFIIN